MTNEVPIEDDDDEISGLEEAEEIHEQLELEPEAVFESFRMQEDEEPKADEEPLASAEVQVKPWSRTECLRALREIRKTMIYHGLLSESNLMDAEEIIHSTPLR